MTHNNISYKEKFENQATCNNTKVVQCNLMQYQEKKKYIFLAIHIDILMLKILLPIFIQKIHMA